MTIPRDKHAFPTSKSRSPTSQRVKFSSMWIHPLILTILFVITSSLALRAPIGTTSLLKKPASSCFITQSFCEPLNPTSLLGSDAMHYADPCGWKPDYSAFPRLISFAMETIKIIVFPCTIFFCVTQKQHLASIKKKKVSPFTRWETSSTRNWSSLKTVPLKPSRSLIPALPKALPLPHDSS